MSVTSFVAFCWQIYLHENLNCLVGGLFSSTGGTSNLCGWYSEDVEY